MYYIINTWLTGRLVARSSAPVPMDVAGVQVSTELVSDASEALTACVVASGRVS